MAKACFFSLNAFSRSAARLSFLAGLLLELLRGDSEGESSLSSSSTEYSRNLLGDFSVFLGEYCSFQSLMTSELQKASILGRCGEDGIRCVLDGDCSFGFEGLEGGVTGREKSLDLYGDFDLGGELYRN